MLRLSPASGHPIRAFGIVGWSGAGKTTLMKMLKGEEQPDEGTLRLGDSVKLVSIEQVMNSDGPSDGPVIASDGLR